MAVANSLAYEEEVERRKAGIEGLIEFSGQNCDTECGWDGESRRCFCGNRRVYWAEGWSHTFLEPYVYTEA